MKDRKKQIIISSCFIIILFVAVIGISYAAFSYIGKGSTVNQITTGTISMTYEESANVIKITNALPTTDVTGKVRLVEGEYFDFSVTTNLSGTAVINWEIAAEDFLDNTFDGENVKFYLTRLEGANEVPVNELLPKVYSEEQEENVSTGRPSGMMSLLVGSTSTIGEETTNYRLRLYVDEAYNPQGDGGGLIFKTRVNVYGKVDVNEKPIPKEQWPVMKTYISSSTDDYHNSTYKSKVTSIIIKNNTLIPQTALEVSNGKGNYWDVSASKDDSVIAYAEDDGTGGYKITLGGKGGISASPNSQSLFYGFTNLKNINLNYFNTSNVTNMIGMFKECKNLINLDLSSFVTSKVTSMGSMFVDCNNLTNLNISSFDTSKVTDMAYMFCGCNNLTNLDLNHFNTINVVDMQRMFLNCKNLVNLDLSDFNTAKVTNMSEMFKQCNSLTGLDLSKFNTSNVTNMVGMFKECKSLTTLNLNNFNTSNVTSMSSMFAVCSKLTTLNISNFNTTKVTTMDYMFCDCNELTNLNLRSFNTSRVIKMEGMFVNSKKLQSILVSNQWTTSKATTTNMFLNCGTNKVTVV